jgi:hypothetical protein
MKGPIQEKLYYMARISESKRKVEYRRGIYRTKAFRWCRAPRYEGLLYERTSLHESISIGMCPTALYDRASYRIGFPGKGSIIGRRHG